MMILCKYFKTGLIIDSSINNNTNYIFLPKFICCLDHTVTNIQIFY